MTLFEKQLKEATQHIALTDDERSLMRERLVSYMEMSPIRHTQSVAKPRSATLPIFSFFRAVHLSGALVIALVVTTTTFGVSRAATDSLPGDLLYPVKVNFNEGVKTALLTSDEARIDWDRERAELRLKEASQLAAEGRLDGERQEEVTRRFAEHTEAMVTKVLAVEETDPGLAAEMSTEFEAALDTHEAVLARLIVEQNDAIDDGARDLVEQVHSAAAEAGKIREDAEEKLAVEMHDADTSADTPDTDSAATQPVEEQASDEERAAQVDSANMRVRAVYRIQERAALHLSDAEGFLRDLDPSSEIAVQAAAQVRSGKLLMEEGNQALEENNLGGAYGSFRRAAAAFQKVAQLLEVADLFSVEIYPNALSDVDAWASTSDSADVVDETQHNEEDVQFARTQAQAAIHEAQGLILTNEGFEQNIVSRVNGLIKDATAHVLRGEIALVLDEKKNAFTHFDAAHRYATRAIEIVTIASKAHDVTTVPIEEQVSRQSDEPVDEPLPMDASSTDPIEIVHTYTEGIHTYRGAVSVPSGCTSLVMSAEVIDTVPAQVALVGSTTLAQDDAATCEEGATQRVFTVEVPASEDATLVSVTLDGVVVIWTEGESPAPKDAGQSGEHVDNLENSESASTPASNFFKRAIEGTQELLGN